VLASGSDAAIVPAGAGWIEPVQACASAADAGVAPWAALAPAGALATIATPEAAAFTCSELDAALLMEAALAAMATGWLAGAAGAGVVAADVALAWAEVVCDAALTVLATGAASDCDAPDGVAGVTCAFVCPAAADDADTALTGLDADEAGAAVAATEADVALSPGCGTASTAPTFSRLALLL
jgi:hypothetical protein